MEISYVFPVSSVPLWRIFSVPRRPMRSHHGLLEHSSFDAVLEDLVIEVHQQSPWDLQHAHICEQLRLMQTGEPVDALDLDDNLVFDNQVRAVLSDDDAFVQNWRRDLSNERKTPVLELHTKRTLVSRLEQARPK